jgi:hypothetical protein
MGAGDDSLRSSYQARTSVPRKVDVEAGAAGGAKPRLMKYFDERPLIRYHVVDKPLPAKGIVRKHYCGDPDRSGVQLPGDEPPLNVLVRD